MSEMLYSINPDRNLPWNDLPLLPVREELYRLTEIYEKLGEAKASLARLQGRSVVIPDQGLLINTISLQEAKASSAIENIFTTDDELYKAYSEQHNEAQGASKEVMRYREALWTGHNYLKEQPGFDENYFIGVFHEIKQTSDDIRPDYLETTIKTGGSGFDAGQVIYTPPRGLDIIRKKLANLIEFVNDDERFQIDHIIKMAIAHFQFEAIHPFRDGNGRTGRVFNIHYLTKKRLLDLPILFLSRYILDHKGDYYRCLMGVSQRGNWKDWLFYMLSAVESTSNMTYDKINDIVCAKDAILKHVRKEAKNIRNPEKLVEMIFTQPFTKVIHLQNEKMYAENTARAYLNHLCDIRVLEKRIIDGHHYYLNLELYRILSE
jgi:Fic family protein